ncbi:ester cyclase [Pseudomonas protegens]|uniref:nuclear transport factor 2 family protein n=1 Tax=Pseudomonas protegens TaxID=380021 RepID=UPI001F1C16EE
MASLYAADAIRKSPGQPDRIGVTQILEHYQEWQGTFADMQLADRILFLKDNVLIAVWGWKGRHAQAYMGVEPSNKEVGLIAASLFWFDSDFRVTKEHTYEDPYTLLIQLGVIDDQGRSVPSLTEPCEIYDCKTLKPRFENLAKMRHYNELLLSKQLEPWLDCMSDDIEWDDQMVPGLAVGKDHSRDDFVMLAEAFPDASINMTNMWSVGDFVIHQGIFTATHKGPLKGIPASNRVVNVDNMDIAYFDGNVIRKGWTFGNTLDMGSQMGMGK